MNWSILKGMARTNDGKKLAWPWWATWVSLVVVATSILTVGATLYDIL